ncbi:MAG: hypothetical protein QMD00_03385 [Hadesarchaea archaeon]|nr:hypothetical protein [Hadesarchaea archaeon]
MHRWLIGSGLALVVLAVVTGTSYVILNQLYGERYLTTSTQTVIIKNSGQQVSLDNVQYDVGNVELADNTGFYWLDLKYAVAEGFYAPTAAPSATVAGATRISVPAEAYEQAQTTGEPVTVSNTVTTETKPIDALPIAASIGIAMGLVVFAAWIGYRQMWGDATSTLLEHGLHDMTVRDIEIVGHIMERGEFTIPELMKLTKASKITVWRTVQKLVEQGLVKPTDQTKQAANGLGGRGKPSQVYKYTSKGEPKP